MLTLRSSISSELKKQKLKTGAPYAIFGALLLFSPLFLPTYLKPWLFWTSCLFIAIGIVPYRKLLHLELNFFTIHLMENHLILSQKSRPLLSIDFDAIEKVEFVENNKLYGIRLILKSPEKVRSYLPSQKLKRILGKWQALPAQKESLFLPFFTKESMKRLKFAIVECHAF